MRFRERVKKRLSSRAPSSPQRLGRAPALVPVFWLVLLLTQSCHHRAATAREQPRSPVTSHGAAHPESAGTKKTSGEETHEEETPATALLLEYEVELRPDGQTLLIEATFPPGTPGNWQVEPPANLYVSDLEIRAPGESFKKVDRTRAQTECERAGCELRYRFNLGLAAQEISSRSLAATWRHTIVAPSSTWLLRPRVPREQTRYRFHVRTPPKLSFATGTFPVKGKPDTYEAPLPRGFFAPYAVFGQMRTRKVEVKGAQLRLSILSPHPEPREDEYVRWVERSAQSVALYFNGFPAPDAAIFLRPESYFGSQMGIGGASVVVGIDPRRSPERSGRVWVAAHELVHTGFPGIRRQQRWATEGLATYVETVARAQSGDISREELWATFVDKLPLGQPESFDRGLDHTPTWGRTYWGGALFWFAADVAIGKASEGEKSLRDALEGLKDAGGNTSVFWGLQRTLRTADASLGLHELESLYQTHADSAVEVDLERLFDELGIKRRRGSSYGAKPEISFDENAPYASIRRTIEQPRR